MTGLERTITKICAAVDRTGEPLTIPNATEVEIERLYLTRLDAIDAAERAFARDQRSFRRIIHLGCE